MEHYDIDAWQSLERRDRGGPGIARGCDDHRDMTIFLFQGSREEPSQKLHRKVFEGERGSMKQFEQIAAGGDLFQRCD